MIFRTEAERDAGIDRRLGWLFAIGGMVVILDQAVFRIDEFPLWHTWWNAGGIVIIVGIIVLLIGGLKLPMPLLNVMFWALPALYVLLQATWVFGVLDPRGITETPWLLSLEPPMVTMLLLVLRPVFAVAASLVISCVPLFSSVLVLGTPPQAVLQGTPAQLGNVMYVVIFLAVHSQLMRLREQEAEMHSQQRQQERAVALRREHARVSRVVHDEVLSAMAAAIQTTGTPPMVLKRAAAGALHALDGSVAEGEFEVTVPLEQAVDSMVRRLRALDRGFILHTDVAKGRVSATAARAVSLASAEALRNSLRHAGGEARREITIVLSSERICVTVRDNGVGFDTSKARDGLGISASIMQRMAEAGGAAEITSAPGLGTQVIISWGT